MNFPTPRPRITNFNPIKAIPIQGDAFLNHTILKQTPTLSPSSYPKPLLSIPQNKIHNA